MPEDSNDQLDQAIYAFMLRHPNVRVFELMGEFDLSEDVVMEALERIKHGHMVEGTIVKRSEDE